jgi:hypothetical protein
MPQPHHVLRGPADADAYRVKVGRYGDRWYHDPLHACPLGDATDAQWPSVSNVKKANSTDWVFVGLKRVSQAIQKSPTLSTELNGMSPDDRYDRLKQINKSGLREAGARGTNVHLMFERGLRGDKHLTDPMDGDAGAEYEPAVRAFLNDYQPELIAAELVCINRGLNADLVNDSTRRARPEFGGGYGGTADAIIRLDGKTYLVDWKSRGEDSDHNAYPQEAAQIGAGAGADYYIAEGKNGLVRMPVPHIDGGLIVSVRPDGCRIYPIDIDAAITQWQALHEWWIKSLTERQPIGKPWAPRVARSAPDPRAEDAPSLKHKVPKVEDGVAYLPQASPGTDTLADMDTLNDKDGSASAQLDTLIADAGEFAEAATATVYASAQLDTLIDNAVDVSTLNAIWVINQHKWTPHHTDLAAAQKAKLLGNP